MKSKYALTQTDLEDIILWPDNSFCYRYELQEFTWKSDDYKVLSFNTKEYLEHIRNAWNEGD